MPILFADELFLRHQTGLHPESPERLRSIHAQLAKSDLLEDYVRGGLVSATPEQLHRVHEPEYIKAVARFAECGGGRLETDTQLSRDSYYVALYAAGAAVAAVDAVVGGTHRRAVCLTRPPGHHALPGAAMGFCLFNNVAVAARHALAAHGLSRVLIVDWDVHHGNGTQEIFERDAEVYFFSAHRYPFYPGTGSSIERGIGEGLGTIFNLPLNIRTSRREYRERFHTMLQHAADRCRPELVLISAGFDAHAADPVGSLGLETEDFATLTELLVQVADQHCCGRIVSILEGGYDVQMLAESVECHMRSLL